MRISDWSSDVCSSDLALREEGGVEVQMATIADVPARSLLSRLTDHYFQIIANRAPIGFEAEFVNLRGNNTMYRGILIPLSTEGSSINFVHGVIKIGRASGRERMCEME